MSTTEQERESEFAGLGHIMEILTGDWKARILMTAVEVDLFSRLSGSPATAEKICAMLGFQSSGVHDFLGALVHLGLLEEEAGRYRNSQAAERHLIKGGHAYIGGYVRFCDRQLNPAFDGLTDTLRTGSPANRAATGGSNPYDSLYADADVTETFLDSMDLAATPVALTLSALDWSDYRSVVDVGGARGHLIRLLVSRNPHLEGIVFDLPALEPAFHEYLATTGAREPITYRGGDFFTDPLPEADAMVFGHVLHNWGVDERITILRNAYRSLRPGGSVFIYDHMITEGTPSLNRLLSSLGMRVWSAGGHEYSAEDCHGWLRTAGFSPVTSGLPDLGEDVLVVAHKDG
ncbi:methyltransferase [Saccharopolyspora taberi]|uniref:Methyltransferase n=1 Tax=Saccharopolyspora taberi TaxID=60895 RepID=A0ABN3VJS4_9PSEU